MELFGLMGIPNSYSRQIDMRVQASEMPYGYETSPPPADTGNFNQHAKESHKEYPPKKRGK